MKPAIKHQSGECTIDYSWQKGHYAPFQKFQLALPKDFLLLCKVWDITPERLLMDFIANMSFGGFQHPDRANACELLQEYALEMNYGQPLHTDAEVETMLIQLDAIGVLWTARLPEKITDEDLAWRAKYLDQWFSKWAK